MNFARSGALALATVLAVMAPTAAHAQSYVHSDPSGDVLSFMGESDATTKAPDHADGDIVRSAVVHGKRRVTMAISYRDLVAPTSSSDAAVHFFRIGTNKKRIRELYVVATSARPQGTAGLQKGNGTSVKCRGIRWSISYSGKTVRASVPRRCLGNPKWVHVGIGSINQGDSTGYIDDANTDGYLGNEPKWGPRVTAEQLQHDRSPHHSHGGTP